MNFTIEKTITPNQRKGRNGRAISGIVDHITAGSFPGCLNWMQNPKAQASAHYLVTRAGAIYQLVDDKDTAWHAGAVNRPTWELYNGTNPNFYTIGIEHENISGGELTEEQYQATLWLHKQLTEKYQIPKDREHIIGHYEIDGVNRINCPGKDFPWARLMQDLQKGDEELRYNTIEEIPEWGKETVQKLLNKNYLSGDEKGLDLSEDMLRVFVVLNRAGALEDYCCKHCVS